MDTIYILSIPIKLICITLYTQVYIHVFRLMPKNQVTGLFKNLYTYVRNTNTYNSDIITTVDHSLNNYTVNVCGYTALCNTVSYSLYQICL